MSIKYYIIACPGMEIKKLKELNDFKKLQF